MQAAPEVASVPPTSLPNTPAIATAHFSAVASSLVVGIIQELAANAGMDPATFIATEIAIILGPMEKQIVDRVVDGVLARITDSVVVGKKNDALQNEFPDDDDIPLSHL